MQHQSDKELDKLFRNRFESFECEPAEAVWTGISNQLHRKKKSFYRIWAAAGIVLVLGLGFWFTRPPKTIRLHGNDKAVSYAAPEKEPALHQNRQANPAQAAVRPEAPVLLAENDKSKKHHRVVVKKNQASPSKKQVTGLYTEKLYTASQPVASVQDDILPETAGNEQIPETKVLPENNKALAATKKAVIPADTGKVVLAAIPNVNTPGTPAPASIHDIKTVGGLVNFVIGKMDNRSDKLIEFTDTDEGSFVSGINLGFVKFKNRHSN